MTSNDAQTLADSIRRLVVAPGTVACVWLGQAGYLFKSAGGVTVMVDPYFSDYADQMWGDRITMAPHPYLRCLSKVCASTSGPRLDPGTKEAMVVLAEAASRGDSAMKNVYFDVATNIHPESPTADVEFMTARMRQIGMSRLF